MFIKGPFRKLPIKGREDSWAIYGNETDELVCFIYKQEKADMVLDSLNESWEAHGVLVEQENNYCKGLGV